MRPILEQSMERVQTDARRSQIRGKVDEGPQIRKISVTPISGRSDPVKLHRERPHSRRRLFTALKCALRANDQACGVARWSRGSRDRNMQAKYAIREGPWQIKDG